MDMAVVHVFIFRDCCNNSCWCFIRACACVCVCFYYMSGSFLFYNLGVDVQWYLVFCWGGCTCVKCCNTAEDDKCWVDDNPLGALIDMCSSWGCHAQVWNPAVPQWAPEWSFIPVLSSKLSPPHQLQHASLGSRRLKMWLHNMLLVTSFVVFLFDIILPT